LLAAGAGPDVRALKRAGGTAIGEIDAHGASSVSVIPLRAGQLVFFSDLFPDPERGADTLAQIIYTGTYHAHARIRSFDATLTPGGRYLVAAALHRGDRVVASGSSAASTGAWAFAEATVPR
jgi:hypothetical protein